MPVFAGPPADYDPHTNTWTPIPAWQTHGPAWVRTILWRRRNPGARTGHKPNRREYFGWTARPGRGWRRIPYVTWPLAYTRDIPAHDSDAALDWALERLGIGG